MTYLLDALWGTALPSLVLRPQGPDRLAGLPHFAVGDLLQLLLQLLPVVRPAVRLERPPRLRAGLDRLVELLEYRLRGVAEPLEPVKRPPLSGRRAVRVHPVHPLLGDQRLEALRRLLERLVDRLLRTVPVGPQDLVLGQPQAIDGAHQHAALTGQVADHFLLEGGLKEVARADGDTKGQAAVLGPAGRVLVDGPTRVDP